MARIDKDELKELKDFSNGTEGVYECVEQMKEQLQENQKSQRILDPQPRYTPDGDLFFEPIKRTNDLTTTELKDLNDATREEYDKQIKDILRKDWKEKEEFEQALQDIEKVDMAMLMERGVEYTHKYMEDQEKSVQVQLKELERKVKLAEQKPNSLTANFIENEIDQLDVDAPQQIEDIELDEVEAEFSENIESIFDELKKEDLVIENDAPELPEPEMDIEYDDD